jgi:hypothetical protein
MDALSSKKKWAKEKHDDVAGSYKSGSYPILDG